MAIQIPNPGTGNGATGDNEFVLWSKVKDNFSNTDHAASRLVGTAHNNVPVYTHSGIENRGINGLGIGGNTSITKEWNDFSLATGFYRGIDNPNPENPHKSWSCRYIHKFGANNGVEVAYKLAAPAMAIRCVDLDTTNTEWVHVYTTGNTTKEAETGYLVASSPVLKVQHDSFEKVHEAEQLDIDVQHLETGVYEITGTTGLRENDGWYLKPPKDINGNVLCICEATQDGDVITLKTYKKKFDFETVSIVADYEQPTDIPDGATVMLRFNELPQEPLLEV